MKEYSKQEHNSFAEYKKLFIEELIHEFVGSKVNYDGQDGVILNLSWSVSNLGEHINATIKFGHSERTFALRLLYNSGKLSLEKEEELKSYINLFETSESTYKVEQEEERRIADELARKARAEYEARKERALELKKQQEAEKKYQARVDRALAKLKTLKPEKSEKWFDSPSNYYEAIGWMAKHATNIKASMPDFMEKWFDGKFDCENKYVVDSRKRTVNGNPMQWGLSFRISFDQEASGFLAQRATSSNKKVIDSVSFVWDLIENFGFKFSKSKQDIENIRAEIPQDYITDFEKGLEM